MFCLALCTSLGGEGILFCLVLCTSLGGGEGGRRSFVLSSIVYLAGEGGGERVLFCQHCVARWGRRSFALSSIVYLARSEK